MRGERKKAQMFIFAAVIISAIVLSMATIANYAKVKSEPKNFYDYNYDVKRESNSVLDYAVYSGFNDGVNISNFVRLMADDLRDKDANASFLFVYGNNSTMIIENYGSDVVSVSGGPNNVGNKLVTGGQLKIKSTVSIGGSYSDIYSNYDYLGGTGSRAIIYNADKVNITILKNSFVFPIEKDNKVIFMMQKEEGDDIYVYT